MVEGKFPDLSKFILAGTSVQERERRHEEAGN